MTSESPGGRRGGQRLGRYRIAHRIGEGGSGVVYVGLDDEGRAYAIKVLKPHVAGEPDARRRLAREVETLQRVRHPAVAEVVDADIDSPTPYIVTRYVPAPSLHDLVAEHGPLDPSDLARLGNGMGQALAAIHAVGVVHRDLKPGNVLVDHGDPVLIDFGIAHVLDDARFTRLGMVMGTPGYLSPELLAGQPVSASTDWWSWAATMVFAASGHAPFEGERAEVVLDAVRAGRPDLSGVPDVLREVLGRALSPDVDARPKPAELRVALLALRDVTTAPAGHRAEHSPGHSAGQRPGQPGRRPGQWPGSLALGAPADTPDGVTARLSSQDPAERTEVLDPSRVVDQTQVLPATSAVSGAAASASATSASAASASAGVPQVETVVLPLDSPGPDDQRVTTAWTPAVVSLPSIEQPAAARAWQTPPSGTAAGALGDAPTTAFRADPPTRVQPVRSRAAMAPPPHQVPPQPSQRAPYDGYPPGQAGHGPVQPAPRVKTRRTGGLFLTGAALALAAGVVPMVVLLGWAVVGVLARTVDRTQASLLRRRFDRGPSRTDGVVAALGSPWHLVMASIATAWYLILPVLVGLSVTYLVSVFGGSALPGAGISWSGVPLAAGAAAILFSSWWGPGGSGLRRGSRNIVRTVSPTRASARVFAGVMALLALAAGTLLWQGGASTNAVDWVPLTGPPQLWFR